MLVLVEAVVAYSNMGILQIITTAFFEPFVADFVGRLKNSKILAMVLLLLLQHPMRNVSIGTNVLLTIMLMASM